MKYHENLEKKHMTSGQSREEGKDKESIQSSTTPDMQHYKGKWQNTRKYNTHESQEVSPFQAGYHTAARNR